MSLSLPRLLVSASVFLLLVGCGSQAGQQGADQPTNIAKMTGTENTSLPPAANAVTITLDHATYGPNEALHATLTNTLSTAIYTPAFQASCTIFILQVQIQGVWQASNAAPCTQQGMTLPTPIVAGTSHTSVISASTLDGKPASFPSGTYRIAVRYATAPGELRDGYVTAYSSPFQIQA